MFAKFAAYFLAVIIAILGALYVSSARADSMTLHTPDGATVVLGDGPCPTAVLENIKEEFHDKFRGGYATYGMATMDLCWITQDDKVIVIDANGGGVAIPLANFMKTSAVGIP